MSQLITIGGDDTAYSAMTLEQRSGGALRVVHVPKTIDNDLFLPDHVDTFGYQSARHYGAEIVKNLMVDAKTTSRWYFVVAMGRKAGHLALGIGKGAGTTLTLITEEFKPPIRLKTIVDTLTGAIIKRLSEGRKDGVAVIAEGRRARHGRGGPRGPAGRRARQPRPPAPGGGRFRQHPEGEGPGAAAAARRSRATIASKNIGYELRCADPIPMDMEYTRDLGYCAAKYMLAGGSGAMVSMQGGHFIPMPFAELTDPATGRSKVRLVDIASTRYAIARRYMIRLRRDDFDNPRQAGPAGQVGEPVAGGVPARVRVGGGQRAAAAGNRRSRGNGVTC